jgi:CBS domain containing-hemolysin-like protein
MEGAPPDIDFFTFGWRLVATAFFIGANGFFVAAEFALVKVRGTRLNVLAERGSRRAKLAQHIQRNLGHYLSACQLGITVASLILGWLAEPAIADLLLASLATTGIDVSGNHPLVHGVAIAIALTVITFLHMTFGEQAPKIWAINRAEFMSLQVAYPLQAFATALRPFIWIIDRASNWMVRLAGIAPGNFDEGSHSIDELMGIVASSARAGHISHRQRELAENIFGIIGLEVRHILVPRVDVDYLSLQNPLEDNLKTLRESGHSRFPLCQIGLDSVIGIVHAKDVMAALVQGVQPDLRKVARRVVFVPNTQPLSAFIVRMQQTHSHCCVVVDEHGTAVGLAFLEDAIEEIVGPIRDEFDEEVPSVKRLNDGSVEVPGSLALPEAADELDLPDLNEEAEDTIGGHVVAVLGRLPRKGDQLKIGPYRVTVADVSRRRISLLRFSLGSTEAETAESKSSAA